MSLLAQMKGETREEIRKTIIYGTPAWRIIRLRQLLGDRRGLLPNGTGLRPNYLSHGLAAMEAQVVAGREWFKEREKLPKRLRRNYRLRPSAMPSKEWSEAACLWRELSQQIESALVVGDDEWLDELAKAIREGAPPDDKRVKFTAKVLDLFPKMETARDIYNALEKEQLLPKIAEHDSNNRARVMDAINDVVKDVGFVLRKQYRKGNKR
jgi:hypothetical protein